MLCAAVTGSVAGCTLSREEKPDVENPASSASPVDVRVARVAGHLSRTQRALAEEAVAAPVAAYLDGAFHTGPDPDVSRAFAPFTEALAEEARDDRDLLTNAGLPGSVQSVRVETSVVRLSLLAPKGEAAGATAHVRIVLVTDEDGPVPSRVTMSGRLLLAQGAARGWEIFGYDLARSTVPVEEQER